MSASTQSRIKSIGLVAGSGLLPHRVLEACDAQGIDVFIIGFDGVTDPAILKDRKYILTRIGAAGRIMNTLKAHHIKDLVFIGGLRRPTIRDMRPDLRAIPFYLKMLLSSLGDDGLLKAMRSILESYGFTLHPIHSFAPELLAGNGILGSHHPHAGDRADIVRAINILDAMSPYDVGQAVVMQAGIVLGVEAAEGTDQLIRRCGPMKRTGRGPVLVKMSKLGQDDALDIPTIGPDTVRAAHENGFSGIVIESGKTLIVDPDIVTQAADDAGLFITAMKRNS